MQEILQNSWECPTLFLLEKKMATKQSIQKAEMHPELGAKENGKRE